MKNYTLPPKKNIRVGLFIDTFYPNVDGVIQVVDNYARILPNFCEVIVFAPKGRNKEYVDNFPYQVVRSSRIRVFFLDYDLPTPQFDRKFKKIVKNSDLDIVHVHSPFSTGKVAQKYARKHNIPCVATMHSQFKKDFKRSLKSPLLAPIVGLLMHSLRKFFNRCTECWAVNEEVGRIFHEEYKIKNKPLVMLNGTDMQPVEDKKIIADLKQKYNITPDEKVLLFVGRLNILKNLLFLVKSLKILKDKNFKFKMLFIGSGQDEDIIRKEVKKLGLEKEVLFLGKINDRNLLAAHYALADLFPFPSLYDCSSLVQIEAASQSIPALFIEGSATSNTVTPEVNGYLSKNDINSFADKIIEIFSNKEKYSSVSHAAFTDLYLPWPKVVEKAYQRYLYLIEQNKSKANKKN